MGFREKMMENMMSSMMGSKMGKMSDDEKQGMMGMMGGMLGKMSEEEKQGMMGVMAGMMGGEPEKGFPGMNMMDMCQKMMSAMVQTNEIATFATPEVRQLFEDWVQQVDEEILSFIMDGGSTDPEQIAAHLKISKSSAIYFLSRLAQKGKISIKVDKKD